jgi:hypothetical protein
MAIALVWKPVVAYVGVLVLFLIARGLRRLTPGLIVLSGCLLVVPAGAAPVPATAGAPAPVSVDAAAITVTVGPVHGREAVDVEGNAPPMAPVSLILRATISMDIPTVFVNRRDVVADADGHFSTTIPIAADYWRGSILTVTASSSSTVSSAVAQTRVTLPNPGVVLPADDVPNH